MPQSDVTAKTDNNKKAWGGYWNRNIHIKSNEPVEQRSEEQYVCAGMKKPRANRTIRNYTQDDGIVELRKSFPDLYRYCEDGKALLISSLELKNSRWCLKHLSHCYSSCIDNMK